jgi:hypothetical protein
MQPANVGCVRSTQLIFKLASFLVGCVQTQHLELNTRQIVPVTESLISSSTTQHFQRSATVLQQLSAARAHL